MTPEGSRYAQRSSYARLMVRPPFRREWDVTVRGRIEHVTDHASFPELFEAALAAADPPSVVRSPHPAIPHTTSAIIRISAFRKRSAERRARDVAVRAFAAAAHSIRGAGPFGWTISTNAARASHSNS